MWDIVNVAYDVGAALYNHAVGDHAKASEHWIDAGADAVAMLVPGLPVGISKITKGEKIYCTYTKYNSKTKKVYSGRTSGYGDPKEIVKKCDKNHHMNKEGYEKAELDNFSTNPDAIR